MESTITNKTKIFLDMIRFEHTIFALPFAFIGALLVQKKVPDGSEILWITLAMIGARTAAMSLNRIIDRHIDAQNPRTANRALPKGLLRVGEVWGYALLSFALLLLSAYQLSPLAFKLFPIAVVALSFYSYTKRFTWTCHLFLGLTLGLAPLGAWVAIANSFHLAPILLGIGVLFWVAGFDIIYACDDYSFDTSNRIHSIPARFGIARALKISALFHILAPAFFIAVAVVMHMGLFYLAGLAVAVGLLFYQHKLVSPEDLSRAGVAFFNLNGTLSILMFCFTLLDIIYTIHVF
ncbi:4-hydroxybenzoate polyprenyltransferase [Desulfotomaculum arcticum]|uniref:4-hydroxybenzoate polyprenyltransferase n=1 Tax=Desulfotruncus arcticus DSM 17038 TaxID=1121424 RepID=A0A1I2N9Q1_9FIRM|nr:UbiA-like polyprenyltransferase [Desulfotruncus arcticus]SFG00594.1 4-hydroxybenzoate polyprenyltransferase [Desulfotomaculum arcticum] [Desulfotruncus arcticus DSM 17038]